MTGTRVNPERQSFPMLLANQQRNQGNWGHGSGTPPPPHGGEAEVSSPATARHTPSTAKRPEGRSRLSRGALTHGKGASAKKSL